MEKIFFVFMKIAIYFLLVLPNFLFGQSNHAESLAKENKEIADFSQKISQFYQLSTNEKWRDITKEILESPLTHEPAKKAIQEHQRRIIVFIYPSDGLKIKGFLSYTPHPETHPLIILYRWGNRQFALMNPGLDLATFGEYTVISSTLRGGVSEGKDEFGGKDVNDMKNLIEFIPDLARELNIDLDPHCTFMIGPSRGGLEMFQTLARYPEIQNRVTKIVAFSAILDLHQQIQDRPDDMKSMFVKDFGMDPKNPESWINARDPLKTVTRIKKSLPILIVQGTKDPRINLKEGYHMIDALKKAGHTAVNYWEVPGGNHVLSNTPQAMKTISQWLEFNAHCYPNTEQ